ncbi:hypothetical protein [Roseivirga sp.]|uniref:hypothetical protein n=1 Tax=Roseivirga sp. TaxID=1964215 RepID=UPI003B8BC176
MPFEKDIGIMIQRDFESDRDKVIVIDFLKIIAETKWNVGTQQLSRAIVYLIDGDVNNLKKFDPISDPRDIIMEAEIKAGNPGHYFTKPFFT